MSAIQLTEVQLTNLYLLQAIRLGIEQDRVSTCRKFALDADLADHLCELSQDQMWSFIVHIGQSTLFPPRQDFMALLKSPAALTASLAAVHTPKPVPAPPLRLMSSQT
jgi:hypothetical protein